MFQSLTYMFLARVLFGFQQWAIVALLAQQTSEVSVGILGLGLALIVPLTSFFGMGLRQGIATDISNVFHSQEYLTMRLLLIASLVAASFLIFPFFVEDKSIRITTLWLLFPKSIELMSEMSYGLCQRNRRLGNISLSLLLRAVLGFGGFWVGLVWGGALNLAIIGWGISWLFVFIFVDLRIILSSIFSQTDSTSGLKIKFRTLRNMAIIQSPVALSALVGNFGVSAPRLVLEPFVSLATVGIFTAFFMIFQAGNTLLTAMLQRWLTPLAREFNNRNLKGTLIYVAMGGLAVSFCIAGMHMCLYLFGSPLIRIMYGSKYEEHIQLLNLLAIGWSFSYLTIVLRHVITAARIFWLGFAVDVSAAIAITLCCYLFVLENPGMQSVAVGFAVGQSVHLLIVFFASSRLVCTKLTSRN